MPARRVKWLGLLTLLIGAGCAPQPEPATESTGESAARPIAVQVIHGETQRAFDVPWRPGLTVLDALRNLDRNGQLPLAFRGSERQAFVTALDGVENAGAGGDNWVYEVNGRLGDRSCGVYNLQAGDRVLWRFGRYTPPEPSGDGS